MRVRINPASPEVMHVDLNSNFASSEQQRWEGWRGKPVGVTPVKVPGGAIISPSYELKAYGVKVGTRNFEAARDVPGLILTESTPSLYRAVHVRFVNIFLDYSPDVKALSIDEVVINFEGTPIRKRLSMEEIGLEIKRRVREEVGDSIRVNIGIGTCRFTAKLAAGLHKPDGMDRIDHANLREVYASLKLMDLPGINKGYGTRLVMAGIMTPLEFLDADPVFLKEQVFRSVHGYHWHERLRGWEVDDVEYETKGFNASLVLPRKTPYRSELKQTIYKLTHKASTRMRFQSYGCRTITLTIGLKNGKELPGRKTLEQPIWATREIFPLMAQLLEEYEMEPVRRNVTLKNGWKHFVWDDAFPSEAVTAAVRVENLVKNAHLQQQMLDEETARIRRLSVAEDIINARYGMYAIGSPLLLGIEDHVVERIPFGTPQDTQALYEDERAKRETKDYGDGLDRVSEWDNIVFPDASWVMQ